VSELTYSVTECMCVCECVCDRKGRTHARPQPKQGITILSPSDWTEPLMSLVTLVRRILSRQMLATAAQRSAPKLYLVFSACLICTCILSLYRWHGIANGLKLSGCDTPNLRAPEVIVKPKLVDEAYRPGVFVLGMHRSGTSMLTGLLNIGMGFSIGPHLSAPEPMNAKGFFELVDTVLQNDEFFTAQGISYLEHSYRYDPVRALREVVFHENSMYFDYIYNTSASSANSNVDNNVTSVSDVHDADAVHNMSTATRRLSTEPVDSVNPVSSVRDMNNTNAVKIVSNINHSYTNNADTVSSANRTDFNTANSTVNNANHDKNDNSAETVSLASVTDVASEVVMPKYTKFIAGAAALRFLNDPQTHPYVLKDPRMCITLRTWLPLLHQHPAILHTYRHPLDSASSLAKVRTWLTIEQVLKSWYVNNRLAIQQSQDLCRVATSLYDIMKSPVAEMQRIYDGLIECGVPVPHRMNETVLHSFMDKDLQHEQMSLQDDFCINSFLTITPPPSVWNTTNETSLALYRETIRVYCAFKDGSALKRDFSWDLSIQD
jgi:hypothetical protein